MKSPFVILVSENRTYNIRFCNWDISRQGSVLGKGVFSLLSGIFLNKYIKGLFFTNKRAIGNLF